MANIVTLEQALEESLWVAKLSYGRRVGIYSEVYPVYQADEDARDFDACAKQPEHLQEFFDMLWAYEAINGWMTIRDFYPVYVELKNKGYTLLPTN